MKLIFACIAVLLLVGVSTGAYVYDYGSDYIIWHTSNTSTTNITIDGVQTDISGVMYGQYDLTPNTYHFVCEGGDCTGITTKDNGVNVVFRWSIFLLFIVLIAVSYYIPISVVPTVIYGIYIISEYLPSQNAGFEEMLLAVILLVSGLLAGWRGWNRL